MKFCLETCYQDRCNAFSLVVIDLGLLLPFHANYTGWGHEKQGFDQQKENAGALIITLRPIINIGQSECFIFDSISFRYNCLHKKNLDLDWLFARLFVTLLARN